MASKIVKTGRAARPILVPLKGYDESRMVRADPESGHVDAMHAFELVLGESAAQPALHRLLKGLEEQPCNLHGCSEQGI